MANRFDLVERPMITRLPSKIIQIQTVAIPASGNNGDYSELIALCEDGSLWVQFRSNGFANVPSDGRWSELHPGFNNVADKECANESKLKQLADHVSEHLGAPFVPGHVNWTNDV